MERMASPRLVLWAAALSVAVLAAPCYGQSCMFKLPPCGASVFGLDIADYEVNSTSSGQRICFSSNTTSGYVPANTTVRITPDRNLQGIFCTNVSFNEERACARNNTPGYPSRTVMHFNLAHIEGTEGAVQVNFTRSGQLNVSFTLLFAPDGIYRLNESQLTLTPGAPLNLQWTVYSDGNAEYNHVNLQGGINNPRPGELDSSPLGDCTSPMTVDSNSILPSCPYSYTVSIGSINYEDAGQFVLATSSFSSTIGLTVPVSEEPILTTSSSGTVFATKGRAVSITCDILHTSRAPSWYYNNVPIASGDGTFEITETNLTIVNASQQLSGSYRCIASNSVGTSEMYFLLIIGAAPLITVGPYDILVQNGSRAVIPCTASGSPLLSVNWFVNSLSLNDVKDNRYRFDSFTKALSITSLTLADHETNITCQANNCFGSQTASTSINVTSDLGAFTGTFDVTAQNEPFVTINDSETVTLSCYGIDSSSLRYQWYKNGNSVGSGTNVTYTVSGAGLYCCGISDTNNQLLEDRCTSVTKTKRVSANLDSGLTNVSIRTGADLNYFCSANSNDDRYLPLLSWYKDEQLLTTTDQRYSYHQNASGFTTLQIKGVTTNDQGLYSCRGSNSVNSIQSDADVRIVNNTCNGNLLSNSTAEGDAESTRFYWNIPFNNSNVFVEEGTSENHFGLLPSVNVPNPYMWQNFTVEQPGNYTLYFNCRMRTSGLSTLPTVTLNISDYTVNVTIPFNLISWQWVSTSLNFVLSDSNVTGAVIMSASLVNEGMSYSNVFFDDLCATLVSEPLVTPTATVTPLLTTVSIVHPSVVTVLGLSLLVIAGIGAGILLLAIVVFCIILFCCCYCCYRRGKRKASNDLRFTEELEKSLKKRGETGVPLVHKYTELKSLQNQSPPPLPTPPPLASADSTQPVYVMPGGDTPTYMLNTSETKPLRSNTAHTSTQPNLQISDSYDYPDLRKNSSSVSMPAAVKSTLYEDPNENPDNMYEDPLIPSEKPNTERQEVEEMYDDPILPTANSGSISRSFVPGSSVSSMPLPPLPKGEGSFSKSVLLSRPSSDYMSLNPSSFVEKDIYTSPFSSPPDEETSAEYVSITNQYVDFLRSNSDRLNSEGDYI